MSENEIHILTSIQKTKVRAEKALVVVTKTRHLLSEVGLVVDMNAKIAGLEACNPKELLEIQDNVLDILQGIDKYCQFLIQIGEGNS